MSVRILKFACLDNYREPTTFACSLLAQKKGSNFIVEPTNGFKKLIDAF
ncbi:hypothetical protein [Clostridium botulinum]|nr:hypothetical protein [Clostridium botulinum]